MGRTTRILLAVVCAVGAFTGSWWLLASRFDIDSGGAQSIASLTAAIVLFVVGYWAYQEPARRAKPHSATATVTSSRSDPKSDEPGVVFAGRGGFGEGCGAFIGGVLLADLVLSVVLVLVAMFVWKPLFDPAKGPNFLVILVGSGICMAVGVGAATKAVERYQANLALRISPSAITVGGPNSRQFAWPEFIRVDIKDKQLIAVTGPGSTLTLRHDMHGLYNQRYGGYIICRLRTIRASQVEIEEAIRTFAPQ